MNLMKTLTLKNLKLNRKRTIVTIVGIILATALLSALVTLVSSFQYSLIEYQKQKDGDFHVKFSGVKMSELSEFKNNRNIESTFETMGMGFAKLDGCKNEDKPYAYVMATDEAGQMNEAIAVEEASFFTSSFGTMTLRTPSSYFALTSSGLTLGSADNSSMAI